ncbi:MAG: hypothetical protein ACT4PL_05010, partial [Phycisphaerales bacterium]
MMRTLIGPLALCLLAGQAAAQFVPPVPPPPAETPVYTPPAKTETPATPPPAPPAPTEPDLPAITLVERDSAGKVVPLGRPTDEAALMKLMDLLSPEAQEKCRKIMADRAAKCEQQLAANAALAVDVYARVGQLSTLQEFKALQEFGERVRPIMVSPGLLQNLQAGGALTFKQFQAADKATKEYTKSLSKDVRESVGEGNVNGLVVENSRNAIRNNTLEPVRAMDTLLGKAAGQWETIKAGFQFAPESASAIAQGERALAAASGDKPRAQAMNTLLQALSDEQKSAVLSAVASPAPTL